MKPPPFDFARPSTLAGALRLLEDDEDAKVIAGGQSLVPMLNFRLARPTTLIDISLIPELQRLQQENGELVIGAFTRQRVAETSSLVGEACPLIPLALRYVGHVQTRARGTVGGSLAHADPSAELPAVAIALDATFVAASVSGRREIPASEFFTGGVFETALQPTEILTEVRFPAINGSRVGFRELARRSGDFAMAGVAVQAKLADGEFVETRLAALGVGPAPHRLLAAEEALLGKGARPEAIKEAAATAASEINPPGDANATPEHRREIVSALLQRTLTEMTV